MGWDGRGLVSTEWLAGHLGEEELRIFGVTVHLRPATPGPYAIESGRADYEAGHVPGAAFLDLAGELSDPGAKLPFTMPPAGQLAEALGAAGIGQASRVVLATTTTPMWATRLWWMLRACGFENAAVLDGGFAKWAREGRAIETGTRRYAPAALSLTARPGYWADKHEVLAAIGDGAVCTINALQPDIYDGQINRYGRPGHIPGSHNVYYNSLLDPESGTYLPVEQLKKQFAASGTFNRRTIVYCGGGVSAALDAIALTMLGHDDIAVYDGSMFEWCMDPALPLVLGAEPG